MSKSGGINREPPGHRSGRRMPLAIAMRLMGDPHQQKKADSEAARCIRDLVTLAKCYHEYTKAIIARRTFAECLDLIHQIDDLKWMIEEDTE